MKSTIFILVLILGISYGTPLFSKGNRIVGGLPARPGQFPYIVSINHSFMNRLIHFCGGSIINERWVVSAAHCFIPGDPLPKVIVAGTNHLDHAKDEYPVKTIINHPGYVEVTLKDDIALLKTSKKIHFNHFVMPIHLDRNFIREGAHVTASGWGSTTFPGDTSKDLLYVNLKTISVEECHEKWKYAGKTIYSSQICTLTRVGEGTCARDSGGPLEYEGTLVGIVSFGKACAKGIPDVFTRVAFFVDWIHETIKRH